MEDLSRLKAIINVRKLRLLDFVRDYDKLRHGRVTAEQFFRAIESQCAVELNQKEREAIVASFTIEHQGLKYIDYQVALAELEKPVVVGEKTGTLTGVTLSVTGRLGAGSDSAVIQKLTKASAERQIIGKYFFQDYDILKSGVVSAQNFARALAQLFEALFRRAPAEAEIAELVERFQIKTLNDTNLQNADFSNLTLRNRLQVDYRAFCAAIGADKAGYDTAVEKGKTVENYQLTDAKPPTFDEAMAQLGTAQTRFRFDLKNFFIAKDARQRGKIGVLEFTQAYCDATGDPKRHGFSKAAVEVVAAQLAESGLIDFRLFLKQLEQTQKSQENVNDHSTTEPMLALQKQLLAHPVDLLQMFVVLDPARTGRVKSSQFKQLVGQIIQLRPDVEFVDEVGGVRRNTLTFSQLQQLLEMFQIAPASGSDAVSPDKLAGNGYYVDYLHFLRDLKLGTDYVPEKEQIKRDPVKTKLVLPDPASVCAKIANALMSRHQKLSDCLAQGIPGSAEWNRSVHDEIPARQAQRSLCGLLQIQLTDLELAAIVSLGKPVVVDAMSELQLQQFLDDIKLDPKSLQSMVKSLADQWQPERASGFSHLAQPVVKQQEVKPQQLPETERCDATLRAMQSAGDLQPRSLPKLLEVAGGNQLVTVKNRQLSIHMLLEDEVLKTCAPAYLELYYALHFLRVDPLAAMREFDALRAGIVTFDQFSRALILAGLEKIPGELPCSLAALAAIYGAGKGVDYATLLRDVNKPPERAVMVTKVGAKTTDYATVAQEFAAKTAKLESDATVDGIFQIIKPGCLKYRPRLREYFIDFDKRRAGICEADKLGAALAMANTTLNDQQVKSLQDRFASKRPGFEGRFEWRDFVDALEAAVGMRM